jgi:hypothetical protein
MVKIDFVSSYIKKAVQKGYSSPEEICNFARKEIAEIDEKLNEAELLRIEREKIKKVFKYYGTSLTPAPKIDSNELEEFTKKIVAGRRTCRGRPAPKPPRRTPMTTTQPTTTQPTTTTFDRSIFIAAVAAILSKSFEPGDAQDAAALVMPATVCTADERRVYCLLSAQLYAGDGKPATALA